MKTFSLLTEVVGLVVLQAAAAQSFTVPGVPSVSMVVSGANGSVGAACESFQRTPHALAVSPGEVLLLRLFGQQQLPYVLFAGDPMSACLPLPWALGGLCSLPPYLVLDAGVVAASGVPSQCGLDIVILKLRLPSVAPSGAQSTLQLMAWPSAAAMPAFSRGVLVSVQ